MEDPRRQMEAFYQDLIIGTPSRHRRCSACRIWTRSQKPKKLAVGILEAEMAAPRAVMSAGKKQEERRKFGRHCAARSHRRTSQVTSLLFGNFHHQVHSSLKIQWVLYSFTSAISLHVFVIQHTFVNMSTIDATNLFLTLGRLNSFMRYSVPKIHLPSEARA
jgi:hypothetical protein